MLRTWTLLWTLGIAAGLVRVKSEARAVQDSGTGARQEAPRTSPESKPATVLLTVVDPATNRPVEGARIEQWSDWNVPAEARGGVKSRVADATGRIELPVVSNSQCFVEIGPPDPRWGPKTRVEFLAPKPGEVRQQRVELAKGQWTVMWVKPVANEDGALIDPASVRALTLRGWRTASDSGLASVRFEDGGRGLFSVTAPAWESYVCQIEKPGRAPASIFVGRGHDSPERPREVRLSKSGTLRVKLDSRDSSAVRGAKINVNQNVSVEGDEFPFGRSFANWTSETDEHGSAVIEGLPVGEPLVCILTHGDRMRWPELAIVLAPGEEKVLTWQFGGGATIAGRLVDGDGKGIARCDVWVVPVDSRQGAPKDVPTTRNLSESWTRYVRLWLDDEEPPLPKVRLLEGPDTRWSVARARTDSDGNFRIEDVPAGNHWVGPWEEPDRRSSPSPVAVKIQATWGATIPVTLQAWRGLFIQGRVVNSNGEPAEHWSPRLKDGSPSYHIAFNGNGFRVGPLTADDVGLYAIDFEGNGAMSDIVNVASGTSDVVLRLRPRARLAGTVVDAATGRPHHAEVLLTLEGDPKSESRYTSEGRFEFKLLRAGAYTLTAKAEGRTLGSTKLQLAEGETNSGIEIRVK